MSDISKQSGIDGALELFRRVSEHVPAYQKFLVKNKINSLDIRSHDDFVKLPYTDKENYISQYPLNELCWDGKLNTASYIVTSSGSTGVPYYWPRGEVQDVISSQLYYRVFTSVFGIKAGPVLFVNAYGQGTWIAGTEFYNAIRWTAKRIKDVVVINPGIELRQGINQILKLADYYHKIVIAGYPPFVKDLIDYGISTGIDWAKYDMYLVVAGEAISQKWRLRVCKLLGRPQESFRIVGVYGLADAGVVAAESVASIAIRDMLQQLDWAGASSFGGTKTTGVFQYDPRSRFFEANDDSQLLLTTNAGLPLVRYNTKDQGGVVGYAQAASITCQVSSREGPKLPFLYLLGRKDLAAHFYSVNIYPENIRSALDGPESPPEITGKFVVSSSFKRNLNQSFRIEVELKKNATASTQLRRQLVVLITRELRALNSEYNELFSKLGRKAEPTVVLKQFGGVGYQPGKKQKWVKKD